ncbi:hypothetical protein ZIOFF_046712 [Zingiber officinale]|uniref:Uncharacterized protein n=1 Tax=Zingiber officinale TaxID=94328 RepID=A0A8J5FPQ7_ZINOF|nr:hypothetical protein ZIOFF_046712 [Zingiber officinale]
MHQCRFHLEDDSFDTRDDLDRFKDDLEEEFDIEESKFEMGNALFDAAQYAFMGKNIVEDFDLGVLEDDESVNASLTKIDDFGYLSNNDGLARTFTKLNKTVNKPKKLADYVVEETAFEAKEKKLEEAVKEPPKSGSQGSIKFIEEMVFLIILIHREIPTETLTLEVTPEAEDVAM